MARSKEDRFIRFYKMYPRKVSKRKAELAFKRLTHKEIDAIFKVLPNHLRSWSHRSKQYIPHPSTWLNGRRWEDVVESKDATYVYRSSIKDTISDLSSDVEEFTNNLFEKANRVKSNQSNFFKKLFNKIFN